MELNVDNLISFFQEHRDNKKQEMEEQDAPAAPASGGASSGGGSTSNVPKWADLYSLKRGKANMLGKGGEKWNTGLNRGLANQIW